MKQRISTILCVILLALQIGALVKAEEERTVSGNELTEEAAETSEEAVMLGSSRVFSSSDSSDADVVEIVIGEEEQGDGQDDAEVKNPADDTDLLADESDRQVSENDLAVSDNDITISDNDAEVGNDDTTVSNDDTIVSDNDAEVSEDDTTVSDNDTTVSNNDSEVSDNDSAVSGNDPDGILDGDNALDEISGNEDIIIVDGKPMVDTDGDGIPDKEFDAAEAEAEKQLETVSEDNPAGTVSSDDPAETVSGDEPEKDMDYTLRNILSLQIPRNLDFVIDPWEIAEKGSVWSTEHVFSNHGTTPVKLILKNIKCEVRDGITCLGKQYSADAAAKASGKVVQLQLVLGGKDVIYLTEDSSSYEVIVGAGESISMAVTGTVSNPKKELWQDGDISVTLTYGAAVCGEDEK